MTTIAPTCKPYVNASRALRRLRDGRIRYRAARGQQDLSGGKVAEACAAGQHAFARVTCRKLWKSHTAVAPSNRMAFYRPVQSNKTRAIAGHFQWVHSIEREKIACGSMRRGRQTAAARRLHPDQRQRRGQQERYRAGRGTRSGPRHRRPAPAQAARPDGDPEPTPDTGCSAGVLHCCAGSRTSWSRPAFRSTRCRWACRRPRSRDRRRRDHGAGRHGDFRPTAEKLNRRGAKTLRNQKTTIYTFLLDMLTLRLCVSAVKEL